MIPVVQILFLCPLPYKFKKSPCQFCYVKIFSTNQGGNLLLLDYPGRVRSHIISVVCQIQRFDFDCNLVVTRKVIIRIPPVLGTNPLYRSYNFIMHGPHDDDGGARPPSRLVRAGLRTGSYHFQTEPVRRIARRLEPVLRIRPPIASRPRATARAARTRDARPM